MFIVRKILALSVVSLTVFSGCNAVGPDYAKPETMLPDVWYQQITEGFEVGESDLKQWWTVFNDPILEELIINATNANLDLKQAWHRIMQARAVKGIAEGQVYPTVDGVGSYYRNRPSENGLNKPLSGSSDQHNLHSIGLDSSWEIDVFGRIARSIESSDASLSASYEDYRDVLVTLYADIASNYIQIRSLQRRIAYARENLDNQEKTLDLTKKRYEVELVPKLDVTQANLNYSNTAATIPALEIQNLQAVNRLAVLLGEYPGRIQNKLQEEGYGVIPDVPESVIIGLPAELIRQRPDIRKAERNLAAQTAEIGVTTADLYPIFSLSGTFAFESTTFSGTAERSSRAWGFGPSFRWNLFDGKRIKNQIKAQEEVVNQYYFAYENSVLRAVEEVESSMGSYTQEANRRKSLQDSVSAAQESVKLVEDLYFNGLTDFQNVLDMQRNLVNSQDNLAASEGATVTYLISLYKSLGGGWNLQEEINIEEVDSQD